MSQGREIYLEGLKKWGGGMEEVFQLTGRTSRGSKHPVWGAVRFWPSGNGKIRDARHISSKNSYIRPYIQSRTPQHPCNFPTNSIVKWSRREDERRAKDK
jgi:hypothetical protein